jgi:capsule polysaccharide export protein KpsE/RkpR
MVQAGAALQGELIAAQSQLEGLKQIYTSGNIRVRSTEARVAELKRQLNKLSGPGETQTVDDPSSYGADYPALRQLPVLGVPWADLFREVKIQEAVFEVLTKQYELAKIQEAKEIPTVKVLDAPLVPEHKSFPPRLLIMFVGTCFTLILTMSWILAEAHWHETADHDPGKQLAQEMFESAYQSVQSVRAHVPRLFRNGPQADIPIGKVEEHPEKSNGEPRT